MGPMTGSVNRGHNQWFSFLVRFHSFIYLFLGSWQIERQVQRFPVYLCPHTCIATPVIGIPHESGTFAVIDHPISVHYNHLKSIVYIRGHSWCCLVYGVARMYYDMYYHYRAFSLS